MPCRKAGLRNHHSVIVWRKISPPSAIPFSSSIASWFFFLGGLGVDGEFGVSMRLRLSSPEGEGQECHVVGNFPQAPKRIRTSSWPRKQHPHRKVARVPHCNDQVVPPYSQPHGVLPASSPRSCMLHRTFHEETFRMPRHLLQRESHGR